MQLSTLGTVSSTDWFSISLSVTGMSSMGGSSRMAQVLIMFSTAFRSGMCKHIAPCCLALRMIARPFPKTLWNEGMFCGFSASPIQTKIVTPSQQVSEAAGLGLGKAQSSAPHSHLLLITVELQF